MNGIRQTFSRYLFSPRVSLPMKTCWLNHCSAFQNQRRFASSDNDTDEIPNLPIKSSFKFAIDVMKRQYKVAEYLSIEKKLERELVEKLDEAAQEILILITECLVKEDFNSLEEKLTPEALEKARSIVDKLPAGNKNAIKFNEASLKPSSFSWAIGNELSIFAPWQCAAGESNLQLSYLGLSVDSKHQSLWFMSVIYPKEGDTISDEYKVYNLAFDRYDYPVEAEE